MFRELNPQVTTSPAMLWSPLRPRVPELMSQVWTPDQRQSPVYPRPTESETLWQGPESAESASFRAL